ncbi:leucine-rich repeat-containing protein 4C [Dunckerocampus dactyliophorus]|uniref:leucine-rich repeat-containing protein 4C n=1 Tax=Dunckerocampus dactyliophorus TaxID=161453 RepID=UPI0024053C79|nr:leucine-rich repeat-containing protein 4C [Dunckerocampus dactyliophorus]
MRVNNGTCGAVSPVFQATTTRLPHLHHHVIFPPAARCLLPSRPVTAVAMREFLFLLLAVSAASSRSHSTWCEVGCDCRGDLRFTICSRAFFTELPARVPPATELLDLSDNRITVVPERSFRHNRKLRVLLLQNNSISTVQDGGFSQLEFLQKLDLSWNQISTLGKGFSVGLAFLRELQLAHNSLSSLDSSSFLHLDGLQRLNLSGNSIHTIQVRSFASMSSLRQLHLQSNRLSTLSSGIFSMLRSLEVLNLAGNQINETQVGVFKPLTTMTLLNLANNQLTSIYFKTFLSIHTYSTHILLEGNPWNCDCDLQRVFRKLRSIQRLFLDDYYNLTCREPAVLRNYRLMEVDTELCIAETVTVLIITVTVVITVLAAMLMGERKRKKKKRGKHWTQQGELSDESDY